MENGVALENWFKRFWLNYLKNLRIHCSNFTMVTLEKYQDHGMTLILSQYCQPWIMAPMLLCWTPRFASELERLRHLFEEDNATEGVSKVGASNNAASDDNEADQRRPSNLGVSPNIETTLNDQLE